MIQWVGHSIMINSENILLATYLSNKPLSFKNDSKPSLKFFFNLFLSLHLGNLLPKHFKSLWNSPFKSLDCSQQLVNLASESYLSYLKAGWKLLNLLKSYLEFYITLQQFLSLSNVFCFRHYSVCVCLYVLQRYGKWKTILAGIPIGKLQ